MKSKPTHQQTAAIFDSKHNQKADRLGEYHYIHPGEIKRRENNPREHSDAQIERIAASMEQFGILNPILVDENYVIISGEARLQAALKSGLDEVPVVMISHLTETEKRAYRIADNKLAEMGEWSRAALLIEFEAIMDASEFSIELTGFATAEIDTMQVEFANADVCDEPDPADTIPELARQPISMPGDVWKLGDHRLLCGSCLDPLNWEILLGDDHGVAAFTDPPYNVKIDGHVSGLGKHKHREFAMASGEMSEDEFISFNRQYLEAMIPHMKDGAVLAVCMDWRHLFELQSAVRSAGLHPLNLCVWKKSNGGMGSLYRSQHELVVIAKKGKEPHINNVQLGKFGRYRTNVWDYAGANSFGSNRDADLADHPTVKPTALVADYIRDVTNHGDLVLDAFMGSGTTILAAERTGRRAAGIEIDPAYVDVSIRRWQKMTGLQAILEDSGDTFESVAARRSLDCPPSLQAAE